mmetsp:Transcript_4076/g.5987  ORF Transcript_4076/g.5987 Transcript_4076/m.5987 type:complete len:82 (+) Transcript_4076:4316-4561(+)
MCASACRKSINRDQCGSLLESKLVVLKALKGARETKYVVDLLYNRLETGCVNCELTGTLVSYGRCLHLGRTGVLKGSRKCC